MVSKPHCCFDEVRKDWLAPVSENSYKYFLEQIETFLYWWWPCSAFGSLNALQSESTLLFFSILVIAEKVPESNLYSALENSTWMIQWRLNPFFLKRISQISIFHHVESFKKMKHNQAGLWSKGSKNTNLSKFLKVFLSIYFFSIFILICCRM